MIINEAVEPETTTATLEPFLGYYILTLALVAALFLSAGYYLGARDAGRVVKATLEANR
jgi:hypothetical protein